MFRLICTVTFCTLGSVAYADSAAGESGGAQVSGAVSGSPQEQAGAADSSCLRDTGSLFPAQPGKCRIGPGRSYDRDDIDRTGANNIGDALERLDPSIGIRR